MGELDAQGRSHDHPDPEHFGRVGCQACEERLGEMGVQVQYRLGVLASSKWKIGDWIKREGANPHPPHFREINPLRQQVHVVWADKEQSVPIAVEDDDGCQAIIIGEAPREERDD
jgi:hypothetical protein